MKTESPKFTQPLEIPASLESCLLSILQNGSSIKEYELMQQLAAAGFVQFSPSLEPLALFQAHFLLFHILYRLQDKWIQAEIGELAIFTLKIQLLPFQKSSKQLGLVVLTQNIVEQNALESEKALKDYYLDFSTYLNTQTEEVIELISGFWQTLAQQVLPTEIEQAKCTLELTEPLSLATVKQQYQRLASQHHPDKGGETERFQQINHAANLLRNHIKKNLCTSQTTSKNN